MAQKIIQVAKVGGTAPIKRPRAKAIPVPTVGTPSVLIHQATHITPLKAITPAKSLGALILGMSKKK